MKQDTWTPDEYQKYYQQQQAGKAMGARLKFGNIPVVIDGIRFPSTKEGDYYGRCKLRVRIGQLKKVEVHVIFPLIVNGVLICNYEADFVLTHPDDSRSVIDVKGKATEHLPVFQLKKKLMLALYNIKIQVV
jgi:hypothetical protein